MLGPPCTVLRDGGLDEPSFQVQPGVTLHLQTRSDYNYAPTPYP